MVTAPPCRVIIMVPVVLVLPLATSLAAGVRNPAANSLRNRQATMLERPNRGEANACRQTQRRSDGATPPACPHQRRRFQCYHRQLFASHRASRPLGSVFIAPQSSQGTTTSLARDAPKASPPAERNHLTCSPRDHQKIRRWRTPKRPRFPVGASVMGESRSPPITPTTSCRWKQCTASWRNGPA